MGPTAVLVPVKSFRDAKVRLAGALDAADRSALARQMAARVLLAASPYPVAVVCDDPEVAAWATDHGAIVVSEPGRGLNGAVEAGVAELASRGVLEVIVAHADLPLAESFHALTGYAGVTLVPDRHEDGTNVACVPARSGFQFAYGPRSFARHIAEAERLGLGPRIVRDDSLAWDVDEPGDLSRALHLG